MLHSILANIIKATIRLKSSKNLYFHITASLRLLFLLSLLFCHETKFHTVVIRQCSANCMQLPSPQLNLPCVLLYPIHVGETIYTALPREDYDNDGATEEQHSRWNLGKVNREE